MRKIIVGAQVSMDGVMQAPGGPWEDPTKGFKFGGWVMPYFDQVFGEEIDRVFKEKCDLLLGRKTYEIFAGYWPYYDETAPAGGIAKLFKDIKKYVVSRSGDVDTSWQGSVLLRDIAEVKRVLFPPVLAEQQDDRRIRLREPRGRRSCEHLWLIVAPVRSNSPQQSALVHLPSSEERRRGISFRREIDRSLSTATSHVSQRAARVRRFRARPLYGSIPTSHAHLQLNRTAHDRRDSIDRWIHLRSRPGVLQ
jgi:dihydrofolate reductase